MNTCFKKFDCDVTSEKELLEVERELEEVKREFAAQSKVVDNVEMFISILKTRRWSRIFECLF